MRVYKCAQRRMLRRGAPRGFWRGVSFSSSTEDCVGMWNVECFFFHVFSPILFILSFAAGDNDAKCWMRGKRGSVHLHTPVSALIFLHDIAMEPSNSAWSRGQLLRWYCIVFVHAMHAGIIAF